MGGYAGLTSAVPIRDMVNQQRTGPGPENNKEKIMQAAYDSAIIGSNIAARYALPAGGVTLAAVGLMDLTQQLTQGSQQTSGTMEM